VVVPQKPGIAHLWYVTCLRINLYGVRILCYRKTYPKLKSDANGQCDMNRNIVVDCAEGTTRQLASQPNDLNPPLKLQKVSKIFVTHMHGAFSISDVRNLLH